MLPDRHFQVLRKIVISLKDHPIDWVVTGSAGMALQGLPVEVHDIDLQTSQAGAYQIERLLQEYMVTPVRFLESERIRSHLGMLEIEGLRVEIMGDIQKRLENQSWEAPINIASYRRWLELDGLQIPVLSLEYEYQAYFRLGRTEKAALLRAWLDK